MKDTMLGEAHSLPPSPDQARLDRVPFECPVKTAVVRLSVPEFTSLCPVTGQPDFAHLVIDYVPDAWLIESKSLKLFMGSFRNHGAFHETCTTMIALRLVQTLSPAWLRISAYWFPRGGIPIDVFWQTNNPPAYVHIPPIEIPVYRAR